MSHRLHRLRRGSHTRTAFIELDRHRCQACWECIDACPNGVLNKIDFFAHRHAHVRHAEACKGCARCVRACPSGAIHYTYVPPKRRLALENASNKPGDACAVITALAVGASETTHLLILPKMVDR